MNVATFDIGTSAIKGVLADESAMVVREVSFPIHTDYADGKAEQDPEEWWAVFCQTARALLEDGTDVAAVILSGQMQDLIPVDEEGRPVRPAILYADGRAAQEAEEIRGVLGRDTVPLVTGNPFDGSIPLAKMLWLKRHEPENDKKIARYLISAKDFILLRLTGKAAGDVTACSTAGCMDLDKKAWRQDFLQALDLDCSRLPELYLSHELVGSVPDGELFKPGTRVYAGAGDAGATTLASGIAELGEYNINLGTSGWVAAISGEPLWNEAGVFNLAAMNEGRIINIVPFLNAGSVHRWAAGLGNLDYVQVEEMLEASKPGAGGVIALPYLSGERFPVMDAAVRGTYAGITMETTQADLIRAMLEAVCYSIRRGFGCFPHAPRRISIIGGGARSPHWCQMMADILGEPVMAFRNPDTLPARAMAASALVGEGIMSSYQDFTDRLLSGGDTLHYMPNTAHAKVYEDGMKRSQELYETLQHYYK